MARLINRWQVIWNDTKKLSRIGEIVGHEAPNIILVREEQNEGASFGDIIITRSENGQPCYAMVLDHVGFAEGRWLRSINLCNCVGDIYSDISGGAVYRIPSLPENIVSSFQVVDACERFFGIVSTDTNVGKINIEIVRDDIDVFQGSLVETKIGTKLVLYQLIDGVTKEEILFQKNTRGYVRAYAKKIGVWDVNKTCFDSIPWLPQPNEPVMLVSKQESSITKDAVGHFPGTNYPISINPNYLVTHNTAILGILGVGKSFLALELVERMIEDGIKVICLDLTAQYAKELKEFYNNDEENKMIVGLNSIGHKGKSKVCKNVEEGGSVAEFSTLLKEQLKAFLSSESKSMLKIFNPAQFDVWRQDSKPFNEQASMASLTPCEITRIITENVLEVLQDQGMTDRARCCLVYEEAHSLIPEWNAVASDGDKSATNGTAKAILQGRKFGLGCVVITQRTANVTKSILNQCNTVFALRVFDATGMEFLRNYIGDDYAGVLSNLEDRHAVVFGRASSCHDPVLIRLNDRDRFITCFRIPGQVSKTGDNV